MKMTKVLKRIGKIAVYGFAIIGVAVVSLAAYATIKQHAKDRQFVRDYLLPIATHVEEVKRTTGKLPTDEDFTAWAEATNTNRMIVYYQQRPDFKEGDAFLIGAWRGEWVEYYCSWNGKSFAGN